MTVRTITLHSTSVRNGRPVARPVTAALSPASTDPVDVAKMARGLLLSGVWRTLPKTGDDLARARYLLQTRLPLALVLFSDAAIRALLVNPDRVGCRWDLARFFAALDGQAEPDRDEATLALLGKACSACRMRHAAARRVAEVRAEVAAEVASGRWRPRRPPASRPARPTRGRGRQGPPAAMRAGGQPSPPPYYRHRGWPPKAGHDAPLEGWTAARLRQAVSRRPAP